MCKPSRRLQGSNCGLTTSTGRPDIARGHQAHDHLQLALNATAQQKLAEQPRRSGSGDASMAFNAQGRDLLGMASRPSRYCWFHDHISYRSTYDICYDTSQSGTCTDDLLIAFMVPTFWK